MKHKPEEYKQCAFWHTGTGSMPYYVKQMQEQASIEGAPLNALYKEHGTGRWVTADELSPDHPLILK